MPRAKKPKPVKHTPPPWKLDFNDHRILDEDEPLEHLSGELRIIMGSALPAKNGRIPNSYLRAHCIEIDSDYSPVGEPNPELEANVRVMAAGAALLAAARKVLRGLHGRIRVAREHRLAPPVFEGITDLRDAIALATKPKQLY